MNAIDERPRILSFGGGVQSSALLALLGQGRYPGAEPQEVWFCDPKNERPQTYDWITRVIRPYCATLGVPFLTLERHQSPKRGANLLDSYRQNAAFPTRLNRVCTIEWKVYVMERECKRRAWHTNGRGVEKHIGISLDELHRARTDALCAWESRRYPLIEGRYFRDDLKRLCQEVFGEIPIKSGCWFCKYQRPPQWREVWKARGDGRWDLAVQWESEVMARRGTAAVFVDANPRRPLDAWARAWEQGEQLPLEIGAGEGEEAACDGGYCMV